MARPRQLDSTVRDFLANLPREYLRCRAYNHAWDPLHDGFNVVGSGRDQVWTKELQCLRCGMAALDRYEPWTVERVGHRLIQYGDADGYLADGFHVSKQDVRRYESEMMRARGTSTRRNTKRKAA